MKKIFATALAAVMAVSVFAPAASAGNSDFSFYHLTKGSGTSRATGYVTKDDNEQRAYVTAYDTYEWSQGNEFASFFVRDEKNNAKTELLRIIRAGSYSTKYTSNGYKGKKYKLQAFYELENPYNYMNINGKWCP